MVLVMHMEERSEVRTAMGIQSGGVGVTERFTQRGRLSNGT